MARTAIHAQSALEPYCIGLKLRALRTQKRLTLARLASETGLSTALLSKLETDRMVPTLTTLATISRVYGVGMSHFFSEPTQHTLSITRKADLEGHVRGVEQVSFTPLNASGGGAPFATAVFKSSRGGPRSATPATEAGRMGPRLLARMIEFPAGGAAAASDGVHETSGFVYVLEGQLQLGSGGLQELLEAGDCAYLESDMVLAMSAGGKNRCRVLAVSPGAEAQRED